MRIVFGASCAVCSLGPLGRLGTVRTRISCTVIHIIIQDCFKLHFIQQKQSRETRNGSQAKPSKVRDLTQHSRVRTLPLASTPTAHAVVVDSLRAPRRHLRSRLHMGLRTA